MATLQQRSYPRGVSVCLPTWKRAEHLPGRLAKLIKSIPDCQVEIILVIDEDDLETFMLPLQEILKNDRVRVRRLVVPPGSFPSVKWNLAASFATQTWLLMATDDVEWAPNWWPGYDNLPFTGYLGLHDQLSRRCGSHTLWLARRDWLVKHAGGTLVCPLFRHIFCLAPDTRILTGDLRWIRIGDAKIGDTLSAFDEHSAGVQNPRRWRMGTVLSTEVVQRPCYEIVLEDGRIVIASEDHAWLTRSGATQKGWVKTRNLRVGRLGWGSQLCDAADVWDARPTLDDAYLAGLWDGEGSLIRSRLQAGRANGLVFSQNCPSLVSDAFQAALTRRGYRWTLGSPSTDPGKRCRQTYVLSARQVMRALGETRPVRLLDKFSPANLGKLSSRPVRVVGLNFMGVREVVALTTDTKTYVAEGLMSHNCDVVMTLLAIRSRTNVVATNLIGEHVHSFDANRADVAFDESRERAHHWRDDGKDHVVFEYLKRRDFPVGPAASPDWKSLW